MLANTSLTCNHFCPLLHSSIGRSDAQHVEQSTISMPWPGLAKLSAYGLWRDYLVDCPEREAAEGFTKDKPLAELPF